MLIHIIAQSVPLCIGRIITEYAVNMRERLQTLCNDNSFKFNIGESFEIRVFWYYSDPPQILPQCTRVYMIELRWKCGEWRSGITLTENEALPSYDGVWPNASNTNISWPAIQNLYVGEMLKRIEAIV